MSDVSSLEIRPEGRLQAEIEDLRSKFQDTQELYREVCTLLFFRHGITPTANKLYQLVRKGSMSAPSEALARFWETLREKSRVRIEHPDLPEELRDAAGEVIGSLWQRAQALAMENLATVRSEALTATATANAQLEAAQSRADATEKALSSLQVELTSCQDQLQEATRTLAREQGARSMLQNQLEVDAQQRRELQRALEDARQGFERQLEAQRGAVATAHERHQADLRRALLDVDRERSTANKVQKELDQNRRGMADQADQLRSQVHQLQEELGQLRQKLGVTEGALAEARSVGEALRVQIDKKMEVKTARKPVARKRL